MYGIVKVSKKKVAFAALAVIEPSTSSVSVTWTFAVVTAFETAKFANGWTMELLEMLDKNPPSP